MATKKKKRTSLDVIPAFRIENPESGVYLAIFEKQRDLAYTMMRVSEYYEGASDLIRGKFFTLEEFLHHFTDDDGYFSYPHVWAGFNIPGNIVEEWHVLFKDNITESERALMSALGEARKDSGPWYLIASLGGRDGKKTIPHELAHARYSLNENYRKACDGLTALLPRSDMARIRRYLIRTGYSDTVVPDEVQAYLSTSSPGELVGRFGALSDDAHPIIDRFKKLYKGFGKT